MIGNLNAHRRFSRHALDQYAFGPQGQTQVVSQTCNAAVLDPGFRFELEGRNHGSGIDLRNLAPDVELAILLLQHLRRDLKLFLIDGAVLVGTAQ